MSTLITAARMERFAQDCDADAVAPALQAAADLYAIDSVPRVAMWLAQMHIESAGFTRVMENLTYSAERLCKVWPRRFPSISEAMHYAYNPMGLARKVYGGRMGNDAADDGWRYRGRGYIQITGRDNYEHFGKVLGLNLLGNPDMAAEPVHAAMLAGAYWQDKRLSGAADRGDVAAVTHAINGGNTGLSDRAVQLQRAKLIFGSQATGETHP